VGYRDPSMGSPPRRPAVSRRQFLYSGAVAVVGLSAACSDGSAASGATTTPGATPRTASPPTAPPTTVPTAARFIASGPAEGKRVGLTFHTDGDLGLASQLLGVLADRQVQITAFIVGQWLEANPDWAKRLLDAGHELANHTYTHLTFADLPPDQMTTEITRCRDVLVRLTGSPGAFFRPSGTDDGTTAPSDLVLTRARDAGYATVLGFDIDPLDYQNPGADAVAQRTKDALHPGGIVSLHFGHPGTITALPAILDACDQQGLAPGTASSLLA
jgi:peptidoglycan/xylan/chitin deacetylase (PgdA/CDA1 family)